MDFILLRDEPDAPAGLAEPRDLADRQDVLIFQPGENLLQLPGFRTADEQHLAIGCLLHLAIPLDHQRMAANLFPLDRFIQIAAERIIAQDADAKRCVRPAESRRRPVDEPVSYT